MEKIKATVKIITYQNKDTGYSILKCNIDGKEDLVTVIGAVANPNVGVTYSVSGDWFNDPKYGTQFKGTEFTEILPDTADGLEKYLASGLIKGVGPATAKNIVSYFGKNTLWILDNEPMSLVEVPGISKKKAEKIIAGWQANQAVKNIMIFMSGCGISTNLALKIYKKYGNDSIAKIQENPYQLIETIYGVGFRIADAVAVKTGMDLKNPFRIKAGLSYALTKFSEEGHLFGYYNDVIITAASKDVLGIIKTDSNDWKNKAQYKEEVEIFNRSDDRKQLEKCLEELIAEKKLISCDITEEDGNKNTCIYLPMYFFSELNVSKKLKALMAFPVKQTEIDIEKIKKGVLKRTGQSIDYDETQIEAIKKAINSKICIVTGGPGTGKTTVCSAITEAFLQMKLKIKGCSPTGKAAKRLSESIQIEAKTIHRLLEFQQDGTFARNDENPLEETDVIICDECSMIDILLMNSLLKAVPVNTRIVFVGDVDQLPSVGAGSVFKSMIDSSIIPTVRLDTIHRQGKTSLIVENAQKVLHGQPLIQNIKGGDFYFKACGIESVKDMVKSYVLTLAEKTQYKTDDIQILCPMKDNLCGTKELNKLMQDTLNIKGLQIPGTKFRIGEKVMQMRNNYDKKVFNGDSGVILSYDDEEDEIKIKFEDNIVVYSKHQLDEIEHSWAITIHKSQGSEAPVIIMPLFKSCYRMLQRCLFYTGITRGKKLVIIIGESEAVDIAIRNNKAIKRNTRLGELLQKEE